MFHFYWGKYDFWVFNIADSCITVAAFILIGDMIWHYKKSRNKTQETQS
jgi:lipoprotein signal peptidase